MPTAQLTPETCPVCGADVPRGAKSCPGCGADERTGWDSDKTRYDGLDLPDEAFEEEIAARRATSGPRRRTSATFWQIVGIVLLVLVVLSVLVGY